MLPGDPAFLLTYAYVHRVHCAHINSLLCQRCPRYRKSYQTTFINQILPENFPHIHPINYTASTRQQQHYCILDIKARAQTDFSLCRGEKRKGAQSNVERQFLSPYHFFCTNYFSFKIWMQLNFSWSAKQCENDEWLWKHSYEVELFILWLRFGINDWFLVFLACRVVAFCFIQVVPLRIS